MGKKNKKKRFPTTYSTLNTDEKKGGGEKREG
jgi:hypothetical protein